MHFAQATATRGITATANKGLKKGILGVVTGVTRDNEKKPFRRAKGTHTILSSPNINTINWFSTMRLLKSINTLEAERAHFVASALAIPQL